MQFYYICHKLLDRAPLRFAPRSTVLPAWLAPLAAKRSVASLPHNATGHSWSQIITNFIPGGILVPWLLVDPFGLLITPGHTWSQNVPWSQVVTLVTS